MNKDKNIKICDLQGNIVKEMTMEDFLKAREEKDRECEKQLLEVIKPTPAQAAWVFHHLRNLLENGHSFRQLIYNDMGFEKKDYFILNKDGQSLTNELSFYLKSDNERIIELEKQLQECRTFLPNEIKNMCELTSGTDNVDFSKTYQN